MKAVTRPTLRGVVFDLDGTLAQTDLDIPAMYERCGVGMKEDLLQVLEDLPDKEEAKRKFAIVEDMEEQARQSLQPMPGAKELVAWLAGCARDSDGIGYMEYTENSHDFNGSIASASVRCRDRS
jgi:beta-phosphoglucomutase-like phosphatase (HAD superfamily)